MPSHRNMATESDCMVCGREDSWRHSLLKCRLALCVWILVDEDMYEHVGSFGENHEKKNCFFTMDEWMKEYEYMKTMVTLWALWKARHDFLHENIHQSPFATSNFILSYLAEFEVMEDGDKQANRISGRPPVDLDSATDASCNYVGISPEREG